VEYNDNSASVFVDGGYPVYETQNLVSSGDDVSYVCYAVVKTPTVPYGDSLQVVVQYALAAGGSEDTCVLRISYDVNYLRPTIMRKFINSGIDVSMRKHFQVSGVRRARQPFNRLVARLERSQLLARRRRTSSNCCRR
jgi:hypothetical protein